MAFCNAFDQRQVYACSIGFGAEKWIEDVG
jgi:hypothetical protein